MLTYMLTPHSGAPLYQQLYTAIRADIAAGTLKSHEKMPSKRQLAAHLKLSTVTVEAAYGQLIAEGYLASRPKVGYFVQAGATAATSPIARTQAPPPICAPTPLEYDLRTNAVDTDSFPFSIWAKLLRETLTERSSALLEATAPQGAPPLREEIRQYLYRFRGIEVQTDQIVVGAGSEYLVGLLVQLIGRDKWYALEDPGYPKLQRTFSAGGAKVLMLPLDEEGVCEAALRAAAPHVVHLTPSHQFPTGVVMSAARRVALLQWAASAPSRYLIEDDYDSEFRYATRPIPALKGLDHADRVIYLNTFAKSLAPSLRIGYMVLPRTLATAFRERLGFYSSTVPSFEQYTLAKFMKTGAFERHINRSRGLYRARRDALVAAIGQSTLAKQVTLSGGDAGLHLFAHVRTGMDESALVEKAQAAGVGVSALSSYYTKEPCPLATVVLGYAGTPPEKLAGAVNALAEAWRA